MSTAPYFINGSSLEDSTSVYIDADMKIKAPDGYYSFEGISRELVDGVLLPPQVCPSCAYPCSDYPIDQAGDEGVYKVNINLGGSLGAIIVTVNPDAVPSGFFVEYNNVIYNQFSSPVYGLLGASAGATFLGRTAQDCGVVSGSPHTLDVYRWNGDDFASTGSSEVVSVVAGQIETTTNQPGNCVLVIPKTTASPSTLELTVYSPCSYSVFSVEIACPALLVSFTSSARYGDSTTACDAGQDRTYYVAHVNGSAGTLGLYDWVFSDAYGQSPLADGYYSSSDSNGYIQVANGIIILNSSC